MTDRPAWWRVAAAALLVGGAAFVVLGVTGAWLAVRYRPPPGSQTTADVHRFAAWVLVVALGVGAISAMAAYESTTGRAVRWVAPVLAVASALAIWAHVAGDGLAWDLLALTAVRANVRYRGVWVVGRSDQIRSVIIGGHEVSKAVFRRRTRRHLFLVPAVILAAVVAAAAGLWHAPRPASAVMGGSPSTFDGN